MIFFIIFPKIFGIFSISQLTEQEEQRKLTTAQATGMGPQRRGDGLVPLLPERELVAMRVREGRVHRSTFAFGACGQENDSTVPPAHPC